MVITDLLFLQQQRLIFFDIFLVCADRSLSLVAESTVRLDMNKERGIILQKIIAWIKSFNIVAYDKVITNYSR